MSHRDRRRLRAALATLGVALGMLRGVVGRRRPGGWFRRAERPSPR